MKKLILATFFVFGVTNIVLAASPNDEKIYNLGVLKSTQGFVIVAKSGTYAGQYMFANKLEDLEKAEEIQQGLPSNIELLEICSRDEFKTDAGKAEVFKETLNVAASKKQRIDVTYFDNGHPLAGMCIDTVSLNE